MKNEGKKIRNVINQFLILKINWHQKKVISIIILITNILYIVKLLKIDISYLSLFL